MLGNEGAPNVALFPDDLFPLEQDDRAVHGLLFEQSPRVGVEAFLDALEKQRPLLEAYARIADFRVDRSESHGYVGHGIEGMVFHLSIGERRLSIKIFFSAYQAHKTILRLLAVCSTTEQQKQRILESAALAIDLGKLFPQTDQAFARELQSRALAAFAVGHSMAPDLIPSLEYILVNGSHLVGYCLPFVAGEAVPFDKALERLTQDKRAYVKERLETLEQVGVTPDTATSADNAIYRDNSVKFIDLYYSGQLDHFPWEKPKDSFFEDA